MTTNNALNVRNVMNVFQVLTAKYASHVMQASEKRIMRSTMSQFKPSCQLATLTECTATFRESFVLSMQSALSASLKLLVDLPGLLDFLCGLLKETGNGFVGGPGILVLFPSDHLI